MPVWIWYTAIRVLLFAVPLAVLLIAGVTPWISALVAAVFGFSASLLFLRRPRESMSSELYAARHREKPLTREDDEAEDAAIAAADEPAAARKPAAE
ncbi:hypothetical protein GCM10009748_10170 [Agromyces lapidis]